MRGTGAAPTSEGAVRRAQTQAGRRPCGERDGRWRPLMEAGWTLPSPASAPRGARLSRGERWTATPPAVRAVPTSPDGRGSSLARYRPAPYNSASLLRPRAYVHPRHQVQAATRCRRHGLEQLRGGGGVTFHGFESLEDPPANDGIGVPHLPHIAPSQERTGTSEGQRDAGACPSSAERQHDLGVAAWRD